MADWTDPEVLVGMAAAAVFSASLLFQVWQYRSEHARLRYDVRLSNDRQGALSGLTLTARPAGKTLPGPITGVVLAQRADGSVEEVPWIQPSSHRQFPTVTTLTRGTLNATIAETQVAGTWIMPWEGLASIGKRFYLIIAFTGAGLYTQRAAIVDTGCAYIKPIKWYTTPVAAWRVAMAKRKRREQGGAYRTL